MSSYNWTGVKLQEAEQPLAAVVADWRLAEVAEVVDVADVSEVADIADVAVVADVSDVPDVADVERRSRAGPISEGNP